MIRQPGATPGETHLVRVEAGKSSNSVTESCDLGSLWRDNVKLSRITPETG